MRHREVRNVSKVTLLVGGKPRIAFGSISKFRNGQLVVRKELGSSSNPGLTT